LYRYRQTLLFIFVLLLVTALGLFVTQGGERLLDPTGPQGQALITTLAILGALIGVAVVGFLFSAAVNLIAGALAEERAAKGPTPPPAAPAAPKRADAPYVPLYDNQSLVIFGVVVTVGIVAFLAVRSIANGAPPGYPLDRLPNWASVLFSIPQEGRDAINITAGMVGLGGLALVLGGMIVTGAVLAFLTGRLGKQTLVEEEKVKAVEAAAKKAAGPAARPAAPKPPAGEKPAPPPIPLSTDRSLTIFYLVVGIGVVIFLLVRWLSSGNAIGAVPGLDAPVFEIPPVEEGGEPFVVTALMVFIPAIFVVLGGAIAAGLGLARGVEQATQLEQDLAKAPPAWPAPQIAALEPRLKQIAANPPRPRGWVDQLIIVLALAIVVLLGVMVVPGVLSVASADRAIQATATAAQWTPTPPPGPTATPLPLPADVFASLPPGDAARGQQISVTNACAACHVEGADPAAPLAGPAWLAARSADGKGIAQHAAERWRDADYTGRATSPESYLVESILAPNDYVVGGFAPNIMPGTYGGVLAEQDLADLVAYLLTLP
jgi:mono/diheme cytochrome c family protein